VCQDCDRAFAQKGNLQTHMMVHSGTKPYVCLIDDCTAAYSQRGNLKVDYIGVVLTKMHQNKFHTETLQRLTKKAEASAKGGGPPLTRPEQKIINHLRDLYKFANKGIKGRGKKDHEQKSLTTLDSEERSLESRTAVELLPPPTSSRGIEGFSGMGSWSRGERMVEDSFVGHGHAQSNDFIGISGDGRVGYAF
jgi:hypothetical protein